MCSVHTSVELEKRGVPTTVFITSAFRNALEKQYIGKGMPGHACIELPHPIYYLSADDLGRITCEHAAEVVSHITQTA